MSQFESGRGAATVEIVLLLPIILALLLTVAEVAVLARTQLELVNASREGARVAAVNPEPAAAVEVVQAVLGEAGSEARISVVRPQVVGEPARVGIAVRHRLIPFMFGGLSVELRASAEMRVER